MDLAELTQRTHSLLSVGLHGEDAGGRRGDHSGWGWLLPQAGIVIGLRSTLPQYFPQHAAFVNALILAGVKAYDFPGLLTLRFAMKRAGELNPMI